MKTTRIGLAQLGKAFAARKAAWQAGQSRWQGGEDASSPTRDVEVAVEMIGDREKAIAILNDLASGEIRRWVAEAAQRLQEGNDPEKDDEDELLAGRVVLLREQLHCLWGKDPEFIPLLQTLDKSIWQDGKLLAKLVEYPRGDDPEDSFYEPDRPFRAPWWWPRRKRLPKGIRRDLRKLFGEKGLRKLEE